MKEAAYKAPYPVTRRVLTVHDMRVEVFVPSRIHRAETLDQPLLAHDSRLGSPGTTIMWRLVRC
jgi:4'-phosphopantetheinyl transferase EntD